MSNQIVVYYIMIIRIDYKLLAVMVMGVLMSACKNEEKKDKPQGPVHYKTMVVSAHDVTLEQAYTARLSGRQIVEVRPQVSGNITQICIKEGDQVRKGQTLFVIDQVPFKAALEMAVATRKSAEAKLATARMNYKSEAGLKENNVVSDFSVETMRNALLEAEAALAQAKAQENNARNSLSYTIVRSPLTGVASMIPWHVGALVSSNINEPLVTVADDHEVYAYFSITENHTFDLIKQYGSINQFIQQAPDVKLRLSNGNDYALAGHIDAISGSVDSSTGSVNMRATFPNPNRLLHNGGSASIILPTRLTNCIVIPQEATYELQNKIFVYRVVNGVTKATPVEVHRQNNGREYIIDNGLNVGDTIIAEGAGLLKEGVKI